MSDLITQTAKLIPKAKRLKPFPGYATAYHYEADGTDAASLGNLYVTIEVLSSPKQAEAVADLVIETVGNSYYNVDAQSGSILERFENALKSTNQALASYTNAGNASWVGRMSAVVGIIAGDELHITKAGSAEAYLFRGNVTSHITTDSLSKGQQNPIHTFANIITGQVQVHDRLVMATPAFFHQLQRAQLKAILHDNTANGAARKLSELLSQDEEANRVATIIVEVTTPELLALQSRNDQPDDVEVGQTDKPMEVAKAIAAPMARTLANTSKAVGSQAAIQAKTKVIPTARKYGLSIAAAVRSRLRTGKGRFELAGVAVALVMILAVWSILGRAQKAADSQLANYDNSYKQYNQARALFNQGDKEAARSQLNQADNRLKNLSKSVDQSVFNQKLAKRPHAEQDPASITKLEAAISSLASQIDGLITLQTTQLTNFSQFKNAKPTKMEIIGNKLILIDSQNNSSIYTYDLTTRNLSVLVKGTGQLGHVVATNANADSSGLYLLTDKPSVWFLKTFDGSLSEQSLNFGSWPKGRAIANYNGNLYMLAADSSQLYKFSPTSAGFASPTSYFRDPSVVNGATTIAIDGSIYLGGGPGGLRRYTAGKLDQTLTSLPKTLINPSIMYSINDTDRLVYLDASSGHIGLLINSPNSITLEKELVIEHAKDVSAVAVGNKSTTLYALVDGKLVSANLPQ